MKRMMFVGVGIAVALFFVSGPVAASAKDDPVVSYEDTPYIDALGNFDAKLAKEYADLVDSYTDADGVKWEVWLDAPGGQMWEEAVGGAGTLGFPIYHAFMPNFVDVYRSGGSFYVTLQGTSDGYIEYYGMMSCSGFDHCYKWLAWAVNDYPANATEIWGRAKSTPDYCDAYYPEHSRYAPPGGGWQYPTEVPACTYTGSYYLYYVRGDEGFIGTVNYGPGDKMIGWDYMAGSYFTSTRVYFAGQNPG